MNNCYQHSDLDFVEQDEFIKLILELKRDLSKEDFVEFYKKNLEKATEINGFADEYSKLNSLEKDLAYAEYSNNSEMLKQLEDKKEKVIKSIEIMLKTISLSFKDLSPVFACEKCNDTGYVGTHRCDCFNKKV